MAGSRLRRWLGPACLGLCAAAAGCGLLPTRSSEDADYQTKLGMAKLLESQGQTDRAGRIYRELVKRDRKDPEPLHQLALMEAKKGEPAEAESHFQEALQRAPKDVGLLNDYGYWLYLNNRLEDAEKHLAEALEIDPEHKMVLNNLGLVVGRQGRFGESLALFRRLGDDAEAHSNLAYVYAQLGRYKEARVHYEKALELDSSLKAAAEALVQLNRRESDPAVLPAQALTQRPPDADAPTRSGIAKNQAAD